MNFPLELYILMHLTRNTQRNEGCRATVKLQLGALYSYPYRNQQKPLSLPIIAYTLSTTKLEIRAK
jgi:hypothetical protein